MKILLTDCLTRKGFDTYNILRRYYDSKEILITIENKSLYKCQFVYCKKPLILRKNSEDNFIKDLNKISLSFINEKIIYLTVEEDTTVLFYAFLAKCGSRNFLSGLPSEKNFNLARDKYSLNVFCLQKDIPAPAIFNADILSAWREEDFSPLIVKPRIGSGSKGILHVNEFSQIKIIDELKIEDYVIQEKITHGKDVIGGFFLCKEGETVSSYCHERIRTFPIEGGVSVYSRISSNSEILVIGKKLLKELNWSGVAMIEFLWDEKVNTYKVIEINPRLWGSILLSEFSGANLIRNYLSICQKRIVEKSSINLNTKIRWLPFDLLNLILRKGCIKGFWKTNQKNTCYINWTYSNKISSLFFHVFFYLNLSNFQIFMQKWKKQ